MLILLGAVVSFGSAAASETQLSVKRDARGQRIYRIMAVGDSITEGGTNFVSYRFALWEKLYSAGYLVEYVGSRTSQSRIGPLCHEGYSGNNAESIAQHVSVTFREHPADIVLLAAGHNHASEELPVDGIVRATESMIKTFQSVNPKVIILLAQVIPSGKLPKYGYLPELNEQLRQLAARLNKFEQPIFIVNQADGFDWCADTIGDRVHSNAKGAEKIASRWFEALTNVMETPKQSLHPE